MYKISFIVPVFNVEKYLKTCIESILLQNIEKEIIIINDGSTDNSLNIAEEIRKKANCIKIFSKENGGLSSARNFGLEKATGKYIWFVDSDDLIPADPTIANNLYQKAISNNLDIVRGIYSIYDEATGKYNDKNIERSYTFANQILTGEEFLKLSLDSQCYEVVAWLGLYKREFLIKYGLKFTENITYEDHEFMLRTLLAKECRIMLINQNIYTYRLRKSSITTQPNIKNLADIEYSITRMFTLASKVNKQKYPNKAISALFYQQTRVYGKLTLKDQLRYKTSLTIKQRFYLLKDAASTHQQIKIFIFLFFRPIISIVYGLKK